MAGTCGSSQGKLLKGGVPVNRGALAKKCGRYQTKSFCGFDEAPMTDVTGMCENRQGCAVSPSTSMCIVRIGVVGSLCGRSRWCSLLFSSCRLCMRCMSRSSRIGWWVARCSRGLRIHQRLSADSEFWSSRAGWGCSPWSVSRLRWRFRRCWRWRWIRMLSAWHEVLPCEHFHAVCGSCGGVHPMWASSTVLRRRMVWWPPSTTCWAPASMY